MLELRSEHSCACFEALICISSNALGCAPPQAWDCCRTFLLHRLSISRQQLATHQRQPPERHRATGSSLADVYSRRRQHAVLLTDSAVLASRVHSDMPALAPH
jgi:hypothetical protein